MHDLSKLKNQLYTELEKISDKGEMNAQIVDVVEKAACALKAILKIEEMDKGGYSGTYYGHDGTYWGDYSGRRTMPPRGYSGGDDYVARLEEVMYSSPDDRTRQEIANIINRMRGR